jgi:hypothetical protein
MSLVEAHRRRRDRRDSGCHRARADRLELVGIRWLERGGKRHRPGAARLRAVHARRPPPPGLGRERGMERFADAACKIAIADAVVVTAAATKAVQPGALKEPAARRQHVGVAWRLTRNPEGTRSQRQARGSGRHCTPGGSARSSPGRLDLQARTLAIVLCGLSASKARSRRRFGGGRGCTMAERCAYVTKSAYGRASSEPAARPC